MRIFFVSDIHGSVKCFRKLVNAGKFYGADLLIAEFERRVAVLGACPLRTEEWGALAADRPGGTRIRLLIGLGNTPPPPLPLMPPPAADGARFR